MSAQSQPLTESQIKARTVAQLVAGGFIDPSQIKGACRVVGIDLEDYWPAKRSAPIVQNGAPTTAPRKGWTAAAKPEPLRAVPSGARRFADVDVDFDADVYCWRCRRWFPPDTMEGRATCPQCRVKERERYARDGAEAKARERAARRLTAPLTRLLTIRVRADGTGLEVCCRKCGDPIRDGNEVGGIVCMSCTTSGGPA